MNQRPTRKDMKRDDLSAAMGRSVEYAETHVRTIVYAVGGLLLLVALVVAVYYWRGNRAEKANHELTAAMKVYQAPIGAAKPDEPAEPSFPTEEARRARAKTLFTKAHQDYGSTDAGGVAGLYLAQIAAAENRLDDARKLWSEYADDHPGTMLGAEARLNVLALDRKQGKGETVVKELQAMVDKGESALPRDLILHELGATLEELHRPQEAIQSYQKILDEFPQSPYRGDAQQKIGVLDPTRASGGRSISGMPAGFPG